MTVRAQARRKSMREAHGRLPHSACSGAPSATTAFAALGTP